MRITIESRAVRFMDCVIVPWEATWLAKPLGAYCRLARRARLTWLGIGLALVLIIVPWVAFPYAGYHKFNYLVWGASLASLTSMTVWWTWAFLRDYRKGWHGFMVGILSGALYLVGILEGTVGYWYCAFWRGGFLD